MVIPPNLIDPAVNGKGGWDTKTGTKVLRVVFIFRSHTTMMIIIIIVMTIRGFFKGNKNEKKKKKKRSVRQIEKIYLSYIISLRSLATFQFPCPPLFVDALSLSCSLESTLQRRVQPHSQFRYTYTYVAVVLTRAEPPQHNSHTIYNVLLLFYLASANSGYIQFASPIIHIICENPVCAVESDAT